MRDYRPPRPPPPCGVHEPVPRLLHRLLRTAVGHHAAAEQRRVHPPVLHAGVPGLVAASLELDGALEHERLDHALRVDLVEAMLRRVRRPDPAPLVWLTRTGPLDPQDVDLAWHAAARTAAAELGTPVVMVVVGRREWRDPATGTGRAWSRLR